MPHPCLGKQAATAACLEDTYGEVDVLAEAHLRESAKTHIHVTAYAHIERAWIELVEFLLASTDAAGGEEARHGIADRLLGFCK